MDTDADLRIYHENRLFVYMYMYTGTLYTRIYTHTHTQYPPIKSRYHKSAKNATRRSFNDRCYEYQSELGGLPVNVPENFTVVESTVRSHL